MRNLTPLDIVYASDENYVPILGVSLTSLFENNRETPIAVHILDDRICEKSHEQLARVAERYAQKIEFIPIPDLDKLSGQKIDALRWSKTAFARLYLATLAPQLGKVLYIDCDTMILGDLSPLGKMELPERCSCAAVTECMGDKHKENVGLNSEDPYVNSGVMLIDLDRWREQATEELFSAYIRQCSGRIPYVDQGVINAVLKDQIAELEPKYNVMTVCYDFSYKELQHYRKTFYPYSESSYAQAKKSPIIVHFTTSFLSRRPWINAKQTHPFAEKWREYKNMTPWKDTLLWKDQRTAVKKVYEIFFHAIPRSLAVEISGILHSTFKAKKDARVK